MSPCGEVVQWSGPTATWVEAWVLQEAWTGKIRWRAESNRRQTPRQDGLFWAALRGGIPHFPRLDRASTLRLDPLARRRLDGTAWSLSTSGLDCDDKTAGNPRMALQQGKWVVLLASATKIGRLPAIASSHWSMVIKDLSQRSSQWSPCPRWSGK